MTSADEIEFYDQRWAKHTGERLDGRRLLRATTILSEISRLNLSDPRILDFGCGNGSLAAIMRHIGTVTAIDYSPAAIAAAKEHYEGITFLAGDALTVPLPESAFDIVVSQEVVEHVHDQPGYIARARKLLAPGGFLILTTPNAFTFYRGGEYDKARKAGKLQPREDILTIRELRRIVEPHFTVARCYTICEAGQEGLFRAVNSATLRRWVPFWSKVNAACNLGLHTVLVARAKS